MIKVINIINSQNKNITYITSVAGNVRFWSEEQFQKILREPRTSEFMILGPAFYNTYYNGEAENDESWELYQLGHSYLDITYRGGEDERLYTLFKKLWSLLEDSLYTRRGENLNV